MFKNLTLNAELKKLLVAQIPADFADWLDFVAIGALLAFVWDAPTVAFAFLAVGMGAPYILIGPFAGVFVDRWPMRAVLIWSNLGRALVTAMFFFAGDWPTLIVLIALRSSADCFFTPAKQAAIQALTSKDTRASANGYSHGINQASKIVAPGAGGAFLIWFAPSGVFVLNAVVSLMAVGLAMNLAPIDRQTAQPGRGEESVLAATRIGMRLVQGNDVVRTVLIMMAASYFAMFIYDTFIAPLTRALDFAPQDLGYTLAVVGIGGVAGAAFFARMPQMSRPHVWIAAGTSIGGVFVMLLGAFGTWDADVPLIVFLTIFLVLGLTSAMAVVPFRVVLQDTVPDDRMGAVTALSEAANTIALLSAPFIGAVLAGWFSIGAPFWAGGVVMLAVAVFAWRAMRA